MAAKFLGQFLLERGSITSAQLLAAIEAQRASNPLLGELAERRGLLSAAQARRINERQRAEDRRFGDIAVEMGLLDAGQIDTLLELQKTQRKLFGEILIEHGALSRDQLEIELAAHRQDLDAANHALALGIAGHALADTATSAIRVCNRLFPRLLGSPCQAVGVADASQLRQCDVTAHVRIETGRQPLFIGIGCDQATTRQMACALLSIPAEQCDDELAVDALGELVNVLMGYVVRDVLADDDRYRACPPDTAMTATQLADGNALALAMNTQHGPFALIVGG